MNKILYVFDLDDTLIKTSAKIVVSYPNVSPCVYHEYTTEEYNKLLNDKLINDNMHVSFEQFNDYDHLKTGELLPLFDLFMALYIAGKDVCILTARQQSAPIKEWLTNVYNIFVPVIAVNENSNSNTTEYDGYRKKEALKQLHIEKGYNTFIVFEDNEEYKNNMKELENEFSVSVI